MNNPVSLADWNGKDFKLLPNSTTNMLLAQNNNTTIATFTHFNGIQQTNWNTIMNNQITKWQSYAPKVAKFATENDISVMSAASFKKEYSNQVAALNPNTGMLEVKFPEENEDNTLEQDLLHETVHVMGYSEYAAWSVDLALGNVDKDTFLYNLKKNESFRNDYIFGNHEAYKDNSIVTSQRNNLKNGKITYEQLVQQMVEYGNSIIK